MTRYSKIIIIENERVSAMTLKLAILTYILYILFSKIWKIRNEVSYQIEINFLI